MTPTEFRLVRILMKLTQKQMGELLGVGARSIQRYEAGTRVVPKWAIKILQLSNKKD